MIAVINSGVANLNSVCYAIERLGHNYSVSTDPELIQKATHIILPGVGHARASMQNIKDLGLIPVLRGLTQPLLGICLGMQILFERSDEGDTECLGLIPGRVELIGEHGLSLPHMGWNSLKWKASDSSPLLQGIEMGAQVYFVHSFRAPCNEFTRAVTDYGEPIPAVVSRQNFYGTQFHPERSGTVGTQILRNFLSL